MWLKVVKGLLMTASLIFTAWETGDIVWASTLITAACFLVGYLTKNVFFQSDSDTGSWNWRDTVSALILAVVAAVSDSVGDLVVGGAVDWSLMIKTVLSVVFTYFSATFFSSSEGIIKKG